MEKTTEKNIDFNEKRTKKQRMTKIYDFFAKETNTKTDTPEVLTKDLILFAVGFLFSRAHLIFGAHPAGIGLVAVLPMGIWSALMGCVLGALTMGIDGIIFAAAAVIVVFLRAAISCADKNCDSTSELFSEGLLLRMSAALIGGFICAVYRVLLEGISETSLCFGLSMTFLPMLITFAFSGAFDAKISPYYILKGGKETLSVVGKAGKEKYSLIFFQLSALMLLFFTSIAFQNVNLWGISFSYLFCVTATLLAARKFGAIRACIVGFFTSVPISAPYSMGFALAGLGAGLAFSFGTGYAIIAGGAFLCIFSSYFWGINGLFTVLPEYSLASVITAPILKKIAEAKPEIEVTETVTTAEDMVGTMALSYQNKFSGSLDALENILDSLSEVIKEYSASDPEMPTENLRNIVIDVAREGCLECSGSSLCAKDGIRPCIENADRIANKLSQGGKIIPEDINTEKNICQIGTVLADRINRRVNAARQECPNDSNNPAEEYRMISRLISGAKLRDSGEKAVDDSMTDALTKIFSENGFENGTIRVFGERRRHFILAGEDPDGSKISSRELQKSIEKTAGVRLGNAEYFRSGRMVLMECGIKPALSVSVATASAPGDENEISGDTILTFESEDDYFYSLISDGMGRGSEAKKTSRFVSRFMRYALEIGAAKDTLLHMLNHIIKSNPEECSATIDLFELDLLNSEATFLKSGSAASFVKRDSSIFRIRSQTAPIGLMRSIDSEKIRVEIKPGDYIIMMSDGVADSADDAPWLLLMLGEPPKKNLDEYAKAILEEAKKNTTGRDDMSVVVIRVDES